MAYPAGSGRGQAGGEGLWAGHGGSGPGRRAGPAGPGAGSVSGSVGAEAVLDRAMASSERSALLTYRLCGGSGEEERGRECGRAAAAVPRKLPTFLGVVVPTLLSMFSVVLFLRLGECPRPSARLPHSPRGDSLALPGTPALGPGSSRGPVFFPRPTVSGAPGVRSPRVHPQPPSLAPSVSFLCPPRASPPSLPS